MEPAISKIFLHTGEDLKLGKTLNVKHPKVKDITSLNDGFFCEEIYFSYVQSILSDPYDYMVFLDDNGIDYESVSALDVLALRWKNEKENPVIIQALSFFLGSRSYSMASLYGKTIIYDTEDDTFAIGSKQFDWITEFISRINFISNEDRIKPATESAKRILIEDTRDEIKRATKKKKNNNPSNYLGSGLTAVIYGGGTGITPFNFQELSIYQLLQGANAIYKKMKVSSLLNGIYTGSVMADKLPDGEFIWT